MSKPPGQSFPFPSRTSMYWETCHVTYDQALDMFNAQTATQQAMGKNPLVSSTGLLQKLKMFLRCLIEHLFSCVDSEDIEEFIEEGGSLLHPQLRLVTT